MRLERPKDWFLNSETYKAMQRLLELETTHSSDGPSMDLFLADFMRPDIEYDSETSELEHLRSAQNILRNEILTAYEFMDKSGILKSYKEYRGL